MLSIQDFADLVECEGLDYTITEKINPDEIADEELRLAVSRARLALGDVQEIIEDFLP